MADITDTKARIDALIAREERRIAAIFRAAVRNVVAELDLKQIAAMIEAGQLEDALQLTREIGERLGLAAQTAFIGSGTSTAAWLAAAGVKSIVFDQVNERAVAAMRANTLRLVREFTAEQRAATKLALIEGITRGANPREQARAFRSSIGLTERQMLAVQRYRAALEGVGRQGVPRGEQAEALKRALRDARSDRSVKRAIARMVPLPAAQIDSMVDRYQARYIKYRSEVIARTEALASVHEGVEEAFQQGTEQGAWALEDLTREWDSSGDSRVRDTHRYLDGQKKKFGEPWVTSNGVIRYPGDPMAPASERVQCRCVLLTRVKKASLRRAA
jgi:uncharacterized protein with gpF-like domain